MRISALLFALLIVSSAGAADDYRVIKLEQDMRNLERQVDGLKRYVGELEQRLRRSDPTLEPSAERDDPSTVGEQKWVNAAAWNRVRTGMDELQVIEILGRPTALRPDAQGRRALLYTLEIGTTGFLTGSISFEGGKVVEVSRPSLR